MSSLLHTAITNRQAAAHPRDSPGKRLSKLSLAEDTEPSDTEEGEDGDFPEHFDDDDDEEDEDGDEMVDLQTRPGTPVPGGVKSAGLSAGSSSGIRSLSGKLTTSRDPLRILPSALAVRVFLQLDIKSLARCNRVCKRWRKSSTLNYTWFLHCRALTLPKPPPTRKTLPIGTLAPEDDPNSGFDPYDKYRGLPRLATPVPTSTTPQWSKRESKKDWRPIFGALATRKDTDVEKRDPLQVDVDALSANVSESGSGYSTPAEPRSGAVTPGKSKKEMRAHYKSLNGRKSKGKGMLGGTQRGHKDLGGAGEAEDRFSSPF